MNASTLGLVARTDEPASLPRADWPALERKWARGWRRLVVPAAMLAGLFYVAHDAAVYSSGTGLVFALVTLAPFGGGFLVAVSQAERLPARQFWALFGVLVALFAAELPFAHAEAFVMCEYIAIVTVARLDARSAPVVLAMVLAAVVVPAAFPAWQEGFTTGIDNSTAVVIPIVALSVFAARKVQKGNIALAAAHAEIARLAAENERTRIARDLHDLLGHSLTTITVKAGLARRLGGSDPKRAVTEIAEVEALARRCMADVRAAVSNYREVTLAGEIATGRELLRAAGITAELPTAVDAVGQSHQELFGWAVREGLTNVVRHAHASSCSVVLSPLSVEIVDDGAGGPGAAGNGLSGLRERVAAVGGALDAGPLQPRGWRLRVSLAPDEAA
jgi:two-component system sensor histidine kinase DesK